MKKTEESFIIWFQNVLIKEKTKARVLDDCILSLSEGIIALSSQNPNKSIGQISKPYSPISDLRLPHVQKPSDSKLLKPCFLLINKEGEIFLEDYEANHELTLQIFYLFSRISTKLKPINEITTLYDETLLIFQGEHQFEVEIPKSSYFFEIPQEFSTELDLSTFQSRKTKENHARLVVHSAGLIQIKPQVNLYLFGLFVMKNSEKVEKFVIETTKERLINSNLKGFLVKGNLVILEGLVEFEENAENRVIATLEEKFRPKYDIYVVNCLKDKWDFTIVMVRSNGNVVCLHGKTAWVNVFFFI